MESLPKFDFCLYHEKCPDGVASLYVAKKYISKVIGLGLPPNGEPDEPIYELLRGKNVLVADISLPQTVLHRLHKVTQSLLVVDHHPGTKESMENNPDITFIYDEKKCTAVLLWELAKKHTESMEKDILPYYLRLIDEKDRMVGYDKHSKIYDNGWNSLFPINCDTMAILEEYGRPTNDFHDHIMERGNAVIEKKEKLFLKKTKHMVTTTWETHTTAVVYSSQDKGDLANFILEKYSNVAIAIVYSENWRKPHTYTMSIRSGKHGPNIREIVERYGGGGHDHACGLLWKHDMKELIPELEKYKTVYSEKLNDSKLVKMKNPPPKKDPVARVFDSINTNIRALSYAFSRKQLVRFIRRFLIFQH